MMILNTLEIHSKPLLKSIRPSVYVTARDSFIGGSILKKLDYDFTYTSHEELDLTDKRAVNRFFKDRYFDTVIHTACVGGRRNEPGTQEIFDANFDMFENLKENRSHFKYLINFGSGADKGNTWYGKAKRVIAGIIKEHPNMLNIKCYGVWGEGEKPDRFPTTVIMSDEINIEDKLMRYIHIDKLVKIVDDVIKKWPKTKREITVGEPISLSDFARILNPKIKITISGKGEDYV